MSDDTKELIAMLACAAVLVMLSGVAIVNLARVLYGVTS